MPPRRVSTFSYNEVEVMPAANALCISMIFSATGASPYFSDRSLCSNIWRARAAFVHALYEAELVAGSRDWRVSRMARRLGNVAPALPSLWQLRLCLNAFLRFGIWRVSNGPYAYED